MALRVVVVPTWPLVAKDAAKLHLGVRFDDDDAAIDEMLIAASEMIDGPAGDLGHAFGPQTLELTLPGFGGGCIELPYPPLLELVSFTYRDPTGALQTLTVDEAFTVTIEADFAVLTPIGPWPNTRCQANAVTIVYRAGYSTLPRRATQAIKLMVGDMYAYKETTADGIVTKVPMSTTVERLLSRFRPSVIR